MIARIFAFFVLILALYLKRESNFVDEEEELEGLIMRPFAIILQYDGDLFISGQMFVYYEFTSHDFGRYNANDT